MGKYRPKLRRHEPSAVRSIRPNDQNGYSATKKISYNKEYKHENKHCFYPILILVNGIY